jgi:cobalt/nickel transport system ATP-binding protein
VNGIFALEGVQYAYHGRFLALAGVDLEVPEGARLAVIGANGSGKSTLLQILAGLVYPDRGRVFFRQQEVSEANLKDRAFLRFFRERVGFVFQDADVQLFSPTVLEELMFGPLQLGLSEDEARDRSLQVMEMLSISELGGRPSYMLSGGEKKRVAIGSVLTMNPEVLLFDEPTNGLDPRTQSFLVELIFSLHEAGKTVVIATHDLVLVDELHAQVVVLSEDHRVAAVGESDDILRDEDLLLRVNLIHEHLHRHDGKAHRHLHSHHLLHRH